MKLSALLLFLTLPLAHAIGEAKDNPLKPDPIKWCLAAKEGVVVRSKPGRGEKEVAKLTRGALLPAFATKNSGGGQWLRVAVVNPAPMTPQAGWVDSTEVKVMDAGEFPFDDKILALSGSPFLEDFAAENTAVARFILHTRDASPVLVCYLGTEVLPQTRLQFFIKSNGRYKAASSVDFPFTEMKSGILNLEIRDLAGDGNECLITREPFHSGPQYFGVNMVIRRIEGNEFKVVGKFPIAAHNFASFPPRLEILEPDEANIGRPGTDTKGEIEFVARDSRTRIVWKGEINFHALGREKPLETLPLERVWSWDGAQFSPQP